MVILLRHFAPLILVLGLVGCQSMEKIFEDQTGKDPMEEEESPLGPQKELSEVQPQEPLLPVKTNEIPVVVNAAVKSWIHYFQNRGRRHMERYLRRSTRYEELMKKVLHEEGLPADLVYVPLIESGFASHARSHRSAVGYWQFIRETGIRYGLKINRYVDERSDPLLSTRAAAAYFKALYSLFGDWYLALAAYNTGENRIKRAVMRKKTRDFWILAQKKALHPETRNYVPKFLAAMLISKNPMEFGFVDVEYKPPLSYDRVYVTQPVSLLKLARNIGVSVKHLRSLNPKYRTDYVPVYRGKKSLVRVPAGQAPKAHKMLAKSRSRAPRYTLPTGQTHRVRRGETLSGIALRYGVRLSALRSVNRLRHRSVIKVGQRLRIPRGRKSHSWKKKRPKSQKGDKYYYHVVKRGDSLSTISHLYGVSMRDLRKLNKIPKNSLVKIGQKLRLRERIQGRSVHIVRRGDTLSRLAQQYKVSLKKLIAVNSLRRGSKLRIGRELIIP